MLMCAGNLKQLIDKVLCGFDRINDVTLGRTRLEKRVVSQDLELWLANVRFIVTNNFFHPFDLLDRYFGIPTQNKVHLLHCVGRSFY